MKNFNIKSKELKINNVPDASKCLKKYLLGKTIRIISSVGGHNYGPIDTCIILNNPHMTVGGGSGQCYNTLNYGQVGLNSIPFSSFEVIEKPTIEILLDKLKEKEKEYKSLAYDIKTIKARVKFCKDHKLYEFDEDEFKSYEALTLLEDDSLTRLEKASILAKIIKG